MKIIMTIKIVQDQPREVIRDYYDDFRRVMEMTVNRGGFGTRKIQLRWLLANFDGTTEVINDDHNPARPSDPGCPPAPVAQ